MKIEIRNLTKKFKKTTIIDNINVVFETGNIYGLIGRNGSGKSVLLKIITTLYEPTSGEVLFDNINIAKKKLFPPSTRCLIEKPNFLPDMTGFENLKMLSEIQKTIGDREIINALDRVNLLSEKDKMYNEYSLGMKQKLGIAQVLMENPEVIILDEPFNGIEEETVEKLRMILIEERDKGKIIIIASHIREDIEKLANIVYKIDAGKLSEII